MVFRHEAFCLWEAVVSAFLNNSTKDYITLDANGVSVMALSGKKFVKEVEAPGEQKAKVHSMQTC